jgi:hypothetical protein
MAGASRRRRRRTEDSEGGDRCSRRGWGRGRGRGGAGSGGCGVLGSLAVAACWSKTLQDVLVSREMLCCTGKARPSHYLRGLRLSVSRCENSFFKRVTLILTFLRET